MIRNQPSARLAVLSLPSCSMAFLAFLVCGLFAAPHGVAQESDAPAAAKSEPGVGVKAAALLRSGGRVEGVIVKRTNSTLFVDIGHTILSIPRAAISELLDLGSVAATPAASKVRQESVFFTADLTPGTIEEKAHAVSEGVVHVLGIGKSGSGFIINAEKGLVVTNAHVVEAEQNISVVLYVSDGGAGRRAFRKVKTEAVKIVALNPFFDLALLRIEDSKGVELKQCFLGDYERVRAGDPVFAIGSPLGLERSVSEGIVSNRNRSLGGTLLVQTTTPINPGNSGGPLFNNRGEVVGVTSLKIVGGESLGFAIPVHYVKDFLRNRESFAFDKDHPNTGIRYLKPPAKGTRQVDTAISAPGRSGRI